MDAKEDVEYEAIPLRKIINNMEATETQLNFIIVDACRDNPSRSGRRPQGFAEEKDNLARGTLIFYATRYGRTARDGKGRNSTFTTHLLKHIGNAELRVVDLMSKVADGVEQETDFEQVPWQEGSIRGGPFFLSRISELDPTPQPTPSPSIPQSDEGTTLISKATGVDYTRLRDLLAAGKWKEADRETTRSMFQAAGREKEGWLRDEDLDNFSCEDLRIIDQLWLEFSQGKFGLSVQKDIFENLGGTSESIITSEGEITENYWSFINFGYRFGWFDEEGKELKTTYNLTAPNAHLPLAKSLFYLIYDLLSRCNL